MPSSGLKCRKSFQINYKTLYQTGKLFYIIVVRISFKSGKLEKIFNSEKELQKAYGLKQAQKIISRMTVLKSSVNLLEVPEQKPDRRHQLKGDRYGQFAVDLLHPFRLVFRASDNWPKLASGEIDLKSICRITILDVEDYHGN